MPGETNRVELYYAEEINWDEALVSPDMIQLPFTGDEPLRTDLRSAVSETIRSDRMVDDVIKLGENSTGGFNFELRFSDYQVLFAHLLTTSFVEIALIDRTDISVQSSDDSFNAAGTTDFVAEGFVVGMWFRTAGFATGANNGVFKVATVTSSKITVDTTLGEALSDELAGASIDMYAKMARNGVLRKHLYLEKRFVDISQIAHYRGQRVGGLQLNVTAEQILNGSWAFLGARETIDAVSLAGSDTPSSSDRSMSASVNVGQLTEGGSVLSTGVQAITLNVTNNLRTLPIVSDDFPFEINYGSIGGTGSVNVYFADDTLYQKFKALSASSLSWRTADVDSNVIVFTLPRIQYTNSPIQTPGRNQDVQEPLDFTVVRDPTLDCMVQVDFLPGDLSTITS